MQQDASYPRGNQEKSAQPLLKVLVSEDEDNIVELIKLGLRYEGFQVEAASDGLEGISAAQRINPDMVILDLGLQPGGMDGLEVCRRLRINPTTQDIPILMLTARDAAQDKVLGLETGADDYLTKPFSFEELVARIRAILRRQRRASGALRGDGTNGNENQILQFADLSLNLSTREVTCPCQVVAIVHCAYRSSSIRSLYRLSSPPTCNFTLATDHRL